MKSVAATLFLAGSLVLIGSAAAQDSQVLSLENRIDLPITSVLM
jgi:hypothetical protein